MEENEGVNVATAEQARERIEYLRGRNRCVSCTKQDAFTLVGKPLCAECAEKHSERMRLYRQTKKDEVNRRKGGYWTIYTIEWPMFSDEGSYLIKGVKGELYPCRGDVLEETYDVVEA